MVNVNEIFPSKYLRASDLFDKPHLVTITGAEVVEMDDGDKILLHLVEFEKGLILNKTNSGNLADYLGPDTDAWHGQQTVMFPTWVDYQGKSVEAIRVRKPKAQVAPKAAQADMTKAHQPPKGHPAAMEDLNDEVPF